MLKHLLRSTVVLMLGLGALVIGGAIVTGQLSVRGATSATPPVHIAIAGGTMQGDATTAAVPAQPGKAAGLDCVVPTNWLKCALADIDNGIIDQEVSLMQGTSGMNGDATLPTTATVAQTQHAQGGGQPPLFGYILNTDHLDTYDNQIVKNFHDNIALPMVDALVVIILLVSGYLVLFGDIFADGYQFAKTVIPSILLAFLAAHASLLICKMLIDLNNGLATQFAAASVLAFVQVVMMRDPADLGVALLILFYVVVLLIFIVQMIGRLALVNLLIIISPFGLMCWALPQTRSWAQWWSQLFVVTVFVQFLQVTTLALGTVLLAGIGGGNTITTSAFNLIWGIATLILALRIPDLLRSLGMVGGSGMFMRTLMLARLAMIGASGGPAAPVMAVAQTAAKTLDRPLDVTVRPASPELPAAPPIPQLPAPQG